MGARARRIPGSDATAEQLDERVLRRFLGRVAREQAWSPATATEVDWIPSEYASSYSSYIVHVGEGEHALRLYLKDYGSPRFVKEAADSRRRRERAVYRDLLHTKPLGTADYLGSHWDPDERRYWLLLEYVEGSPLKAHGFSTWLASAVWLGRFHGMFHRDHEALRTRRFLARHDETFFLRTAHRAVEASRTFSKAFADRLMEVVAEYRRIVPRMTRGPGTLVHGSYLPADILVAGDDDAVRICPVDWELAAYGAPYYDLAFFVDGFEGRELEDLLDAYCQAAADEGLVLPCEDILRHLKCFRLHKVLLWLGQSRSRGYSTESVAQLLETALSLRREIESHFAATRGGAR